VRYSTVRAARSSKGMPTPSNSSRHQPTPAPRITRPPERWSAVARALAVWTGFRYGMTRTLVPTWIFWVMVRRYVTAVSGSSHGSSGPSGKAPVGK
jgi:hypothetical protein